MNGYRDKRAQAPPVMARSFFFLIGSGVAIMASVDLLERTVEAQRLAWAAGLIGTSVLGLPLCWIARRRKFYDPKNGYFFQIAVTCLLLLAASALVGVNAGALMNGYCGKRTEYSITTESLGVSYNGGRRKGWSLYFLMPGFLNQKVELKDGEKAKFADQKFIELHLRSGLFNFPLIESYGIPSTNQIPNQPH